MVGSRWSELPGPVRAVAVVVPGVLGQHPAEVPFAEDQHPVGQLGAGSQHEPLRVSVRAGAPGRDLHHLDAGVGEHGIEGGGELTGPVTDQVREPRRTVTKVVEKIPGLLGGPRPVGVGGDPEDVQVARFHLQDEQDVDAPQCHGVDVEEVDGQRRGRLDAQELPPVGVAAAGRSRGYPGPLWGSGGSSRQRPSDPACAARPGCAGTPTRRCPGPAARPARRPPSAPAAGRCGSGRSTYSRPDGGANAGPNPG